MNTQCRGIEQYNVETYRQTSTRRWLSSALGALLVAQFVGLGLWQVGRAQEKRAAQEAFERQAGFTRFVHGMDVKPFQQLAAEGLPEGRLAHVLRTLIDSPERFLRFLRALLGGLDGLVDWSVGEGTGGGSQAWAVGLGGETLLEDLVRVASRDPKRLQPVKKLIDDLRSTEEGRQIVPDDLYAVWTVVEEAIGNG